MPSEQKTVAQNLQIAEEHAALRRLLGVISELAVEGGEPSARYAELAGHLMSQLKEHFAEEEEEVDGVFDQIVSDAPRLATEVNRLRREHIDFLSDAQRLLDIAEAGDAVQEWRGRFGETFIRLQDALLRHESDENELLQQTYGDDIGDKD